MGNDAAIPAPLKRRPRRPPLGQPEPVAMPLRLKRQAVTAVLVEPPAKPKPRLRITAMLGMTLWMLLWMGYNTDAGGWADPNYPATTMELIHGVRSFFPILAAWFALLLIVVRSRRVLPWLIGPLGLILLYALAGLVSSAAYSPGPAMSLYFGANYLAIVLVLLASMIAEDPLPDIKKVLMLTWVVGAMFTLGLLGIIPVMGGQALTETATNPVGKMAYAHVTAIAGMEGSRNTGFARYAAISALVALCSVMRKGKLLVRVAWALLLVLSLYALVLANGRTETMAFVASLVVALTVDRTQRFRNFVVGCAVGVVLGLRGFYAAFYQYLTRGHHVDLTMTGRTRVWEEGWSLLGQSPWLGYGFQSDRYFLGWHMHNAFLHVLFQSGFLGGGAILIGLLIVWYYLIKYFFIRQPADASLIPPEIPAVFLFVTLSSFLESTFAYFSAAWLLSAPIVAYVVALHQRLQRESAKVAQEKWTYPIPRRSRILGSPLDDASSPPAVPIAG